MEYRVRVSRDKERSSCMLNFLIINERMLFKNFKEVKEFYYKEVKNEFLVRGVSLKV